MDKYIGTIFAFAFDSTTDPDFLPCDGRLLNIYEYDQLYSLIQNNFGGDGQSTFALPDLRGRMPVGFGKTYTYVGKQDGAEQVRLTGDNLPPHTHTAIAEGVLVSVATTDSATPASTYLAPNIIASTGNAFAAAADAGSFMSPMTSATPQDGGPGNMFDVRTPYLAVKYCICINGVYPSRPR